LAIKKYARKRNENASSLEHGMEIKIIQSNQAKSKNKNLVNKIGEFNLQNYVNAKIQLLCKLQEGPTNSGEKYDRKSELNELIIQEINLLTQLLENKQR
jgi:hypothetical protein